ncbi:diphthine--ammonia ligase-like [Bidens hawaiensis]|uniref:diphthine--ammonia ligase-like n=1 Tax=Bidens hawaiensis TaxID=980011 RepID=UPI00404A6889
MKVVGLVSGGKDSCFAMMKCLEYGHEVVALANLLPVNDSVDELDSYMYQTVGHQIVVSYANCMGLPLFRRKIQGSTRRHDLSYNKTLGDEVEDMFILLKEVKKQIPSITAVSSGAIASDYQRLRVENVCSRLGLISLAYLWKLDQSLLLQQMIESGIVAITVKVAAIGLDPSKHLGKEMSQLWPHLRKLNELYGSNICGEGGEYETLTLDCPLFKYARIVLDEFQHVLHDSNSISPVGILHPLAFHCEDKSQSASITDINRINGSVIEVQTESSEIVEEKSQPSDVALDLTPLENRKIHISKTKKENTFSISCWLQDPTKSSDLQEDLKIVLLKIESQLNEVGFSWENVVYIHLYISDMNMFAIANETYVKFITQQKCRFGVPSRSTIELPLSHVGLGNAYVEVLVANDNSKKVLHVQSISSWAPSCIGPYSQATLHKEILHMAGQLGLDPPTMSLCDGGPVSELEQALINSEAIAKSFNCSISTSAILFVIYCSKSTSSLDRISMQEKHNEILNQIKPLNLKHNRHSGVLNPLFLYVLVPDLPKSAFVEVKPVLFVEDDTETEEVVNDHAMSDLRHEVNPFDSCFQPEKWHDECLQKCVVCGRICAVILSITTEIADKISSDDNLIISDEEKMEKVAQFCLYRLDKVLSQNDFSWDDVMSLRIHYSVSSNISHETPSLIIQSKFDEFSEKKKKVKTFEEPIFNIVPVIGAGSCATSMDDIITCELFARKS